MTRTLWSNHEYIYISRWNNLLEMNVETMCKCQSLASSQVWCNLILIYLSLLLIRNQNHDDVSSCSCLANWQNLQTFALSNSLGLGTVIKAYYNVQTALLQVQRMGMSLGTITNNSNGLVLDNFPIYILVIKDFCHNTLSPHNVLVLYARPAPGR